MALSTARLSAHLESILDTRPRLDILVEGPVRGPDGTRLWQSGTTPGYLRVLWPDAAGVARGRVVCVPDSVFVQPERGDAALVGRLMGREAA